MSMQPPASIIWPETPSAKRRSGSPTASQRISCKAIDVSVAAGYGLSDRLSVMSTRPILVSPRHRLVGARKRAGKPYFRGLSESLSFCRAAAGRARCDRHRSSAGSGYCPTGSRSASAGAPPRLQTAATGRSIQGGSGGLIINRNTPYAGCRTVRTGGATSGQVSPATSCSRCRLQRSGLSVGSINWRDIIKHLRRQPGLNNAEPPVSFLRRGAAVESDLRNAEWTGAT